MTDRTEDNFKEALQTLVANEPEKLAFYDGADKGAIPPFVYEEVKEDTRTKVVNAGAGRRRRNMFGLLAAAACSLVFVVASVLNYGPDTAVKMTASGGAAPESVIHMPAQENADEEYTREAVTMDAGGESAESAPYIFPLLVIGAVVFAVLFLVLFIHRRRLN